MAVIEKKAKIMTSTGHLMNTTRHHHTIIVHDRQADEPRIDGDTWIEDLEKWGYKITEKKNKSHFEKGSFQEYKAHRRRRIPEKHKQTTSGMS